MALDWSKQISFSGLRKPGGKKQTEYPSKTYMNLIIRDKSEVDLGKTAVVAVVAAIVVALFTKFAVLDVIARIDARQSVLSSDRQALNLVQSQLADYDLVLAQYKSYETVRAGEEEPTVNVIDALALVDDVIAPAAQISAVNVAGNTLTLDLADISLDGVGDLVSELNTRDIVSNVSVSTASTGQEDGAGITTAMVVTMHVPEAQADGQGAAQAEAQGSAQQ